MTKIFAVCIWVASKSTICTCIHLVKYGGCLVIVPVNMHTNVLRNLLSAFVNQTFINRCAVLVAYLNELAC